MRHDAVAEGLRWLEQALADRKGAQLLFDGASYHPACFVGQQIAEKVLKAFLYTRGEDVVRYPSGLPDSIPARVYNRPVAEEVLRLADRRYGWSSQKLAQSGTSG
ncbi:MAG: HEPN domain-containing protein [Desulfobacteraceae bacterium]|nr:MAG: HEPN domain-containing protein [Desulfobacteraceae bacterium]